MLAGNSPVLVHNTGACPRLWMDPKKVNHHFEHALDFGVAGKATNETRAHFLARIQEFVKAAGTISFRGTFRGQKAIHYVDPETGLHASYVADGADIGKYLGGWKSEPSTDQFTYLMRDGVL